MDNQTKQKKGFWGRMMDKLDQAMKAQAQKPSCGCGCSAKTGDDDQPKDQTCCHG